MNRTYTLSATFAGYSFSAPVAFSDLGSNRTANFTGIAVPGLEFFPVTPCRLADTRVSSFRSGFGPPSMMAGQTRTFAIPSNSACRNTLPTAAAYSLNVTVVTKGYLGILSIWPAGQSMPNVSTLNSYSNSSTAVANAAIVPAGTNGAINVYVTRCDRCDPRHQRLLRSAASHPVRVLSALSVSTGGYASGYVSIRFRPTIYDHRNGAYVSHSH